MSKTETDGECVVYTGLLTPSGYGTVTVNHVPRRAHMVVAEHHFGPIPPGFIVLHSCDNRRCVHIDHLRLGTHAENMADMTGRGRQAKGEAHGMAVHSEELVRLVRADTRPRREIAAAFGLTESQVKHLRDRRAWRHL